LSMDPSRRLGLLKGKTVRQSRVLPPPKARKSSPSHWRRPVIQILALGVLGILPFVVLVRGAVYFYESRAWPAWLALFAAASATLLLVAGYGTWVTRRVPGRPRFRSVLTWGAPPPAVG